MRATISPASCPYPPTSAMATANSSLPSPMSCQRRRPRSAHLSARCRTWDRFVPWRAPSHAHRMCLRKRGRIQRQCQGWLTDHIACEATPSYSKSECQCLISLNPFRSLTASAHRLLTWLLFCARKLQVSWILSLI